MKRMKTIACGFFLLAGLTVVTGNSVSAEMTSVEKKGTVTVEGSSISEPIDPENPGDIIDPGEGPSTDGLLRIDFVSAFDFGRAERVGTKRTFPAFAQQFLGNTEPRGSYIQLTDQRTHSTGWTLQVKQNHQFRTTEKHAGKVQELTGAVLSLDKGWANSNGNSGAPTVTRETVGIQAIGTAYEVATATAGNGRGIWTIAFGASETNTSHQQPTLRPAVDSSGKPIMDAFSGKPAYWNSAIGLTVPETIPIYTGEYHTALTWVLGALP